MIPAVCYACRLWCPLPCHKWVWLNWYLSTLGWRWKASITAMFCCLSRCFQQWNVSQNVVYSQNNNMLLTAKLVIFLFSVISQGKVVALDRWGGKWNHLSMTHRLTTKYANNYCNRTLIVKVIVENLVTCFYGTQFAGRRAAAAPRLRHLAWSANRPNNIGALQSANNHSLFVISRPH